MYIKNGKNPQLIEMVVDYIQKGLSIPVTYQPWEKTDRVPLYLRSRYLFFTLNIQSQTFLLFINQNEFEQTPVKLRNSIDFIKKKWRIDVIYSSSKITFYNRQRFIELNIQFIIPYNQMYLPSLGFELRENLKKFRYNNPFI
ncbi:hypothetical protein LLG10_05315 [bacterium]|nr:hypothetical protein [bacterium]